MNAVQTQQDAEEIGTFLNEHVGHFLTECLRGEQPESKIEGNPVVRQGHHLQGM